MTDEIAILYPNPAKTELSVEVKGLKGGLDVTITNAQGMGVLKRSFANPGEILRVDGLDKLAAGIYVLTIHDSAGKRQSAEFIKH